MSQARFALLAAAVCVAAAATGFYVSLRWYAEPATADVLGEPAPAIELLDLDGQRLSLAKWRGKLVLVNFWASWCAPCMNEIPLLVDAQRRHGARGLQVFGPAMDDAASVRGVVARFAINYPVTADVAGADAAMQALGNVHGALPYSVLISRDGLVLTTVLGALSAEELERLVETYLDS